MSQELPAPLVPPEVDFARLDGFMLDTVALLGSELVALSTGEEFKAAVLLWCRAWKQRPACSLPDNDRVLASFAMVTPARWRKVRDMALRGFVKCSDGRLYHPVLAKDALRADAARRQRSEAIKRRWEKERGSDTDQPTKPHTESIRPYNGEPTKQIPSDARDGTGRDGTEERYSDADASAPGGALNDPKAYVFGDLLAWLREHTGRSEATLRSFLGKCCQRFGDEATAGAGMMVRAPPVPVDPISSMKARLERQAGTHGTKRQGSDPVTGIYGGFALALAEREREADRGADSDPAEPLLGGRHAG